MVYKKGSFCLCVSEINTLLWEYHCPLYDEGKQWEQMEEMMLLGLGCRQQVSSAEKTGRAGSGGRGGGWGVQ